MALMIELTARELLLVRRALERQRRTMQKWIERGSMSTRTRNDSDESTVRSWIADVETMTKLLEELGA